MTKIFCDICGKPMIYSEANYSLSLIGKKENEFKSILNKNNILCPDVCENCAEKIKFYVDSIRKENNNKE